MSQKRKVLLANPRGFCAGVVRAIETVEKALSIWGAPIYVKHEIVHNRHVVDDLKKRGAIFIEDVQDVPIGSRLIFSAHGVSPLVRKEAQERNLEVIDATCGLVTRVHSAVIRFAAQGYTIILIGHRNHVETIGTYGEAPDKTVIVESVQDVKNLHFEKNTPLFYLTQTTLSLDDVRDITEELRKKFPQIETLPTSSVCYATTNRQMALRSMMDEVDLVLVVGDSQSSNSNRLKEVAQNRGKRGYLINEADEIKSEWIGPEVYTVGMTAGASTPEHVVQSCLERLQKLGFNEVQDVVFTQEDIVFQLPKPILEKTQPKAICH